MLAGIVMPTATRPSRARDQRIRTGPRWVATVPDARIVSAGRATVTCAAPGVSTRTPRTSCCRTVEHR